MKFQPGQSGNPNGRPRKVDKFAGQIADHLPQIIAAQLQLALGVTVQEVDEDTGGVMIYAKPPDHKAGAYLIDRILGKPTSSLEVSDPDGGPLKVIIQYADPDDHPAPPASGPAADQAGSETL